MTEHLAIEANGARLDEQRFPGRQGRILFAYLAAQKGRPVPRDELAELLWGEELPATWEKALRVLMTKLRALLEECGLDGSSVLTSAFGCYQLTLPDDAWVDVHAALDAVEQAEHALAAGELDEARVRASAAAALARRSFLPGEEGSWVEEKRRDLREILVRSLVCHYEASFGAGELADAVRYSEELTELEPYRESTYRALMQAHAAAGNPAEALRVYERCRTLLADELGAYPSPETESVYRDLLRVPSPLVRAEHRETDRSVVESEQARAGRGDAASSGRQRRRTALGVALLAAIVLAAVVVLGGVRESASQAVGSSTRVALLVPRQPRPDRPDTYVNPLVDGLRLAERELGVAGEIFVLDELHPESPGARRTVERVVAGRFDLVVAASIGLAQPFGDVELPGTRWVVFNSPVDVPDATGFLFDDRQVGFLAGYLSGLMERTHAPRLNRPHVLSVIGGIPGVPAVEKLIAGFDEGARRALPDVTIHTSYSNDFVDRSKCEAIANRHIDRGADIVFAAAGTCGLGALSTAALRGVWAIGVDGDRSHLGAHILASTVKRGDQAVLIAVRSYLNGTLPGGSTITLGLDDDVTALVGLSPAVPDAIRRKVSFKAAELSKAPQPR